MRYVILASHIGKTLRAILTRQNLVTHANPAFQGRSRELTAYRDFIVPALPQHGWKTALTAIKTM
jgi:hypothetical protein